MTDLHGNAVGIKKEDNGAQEIRFPDPIVLFGYRFDLSYKETMPCNTPSAWALSFDFATFVAKRAKQLC